MRFKITYLHHIDLEEKECVHSKSTTFKVLLKDLFEYVHQGQIDIALLKSES